MSEKVENRKNLETNSQLFQDHEIDSVSSEDSLFYPTLSHISSKDSEIKSKYDKDEFKTSSFQTNELPFPDISNQTNNKSIKLIDVSKLLTKKEVIPNQSLFPSGKTTDEDNSNTDSTSTTSESDQSEEVSKQEVFSADNDKPVPYVNEDDNLKVKDKKKDSKRTKMLGSYHRINKVFRRDIVDDDSYISVLDSRALSSDISISLQSRFSNSAEALQMKHHLFKENSRMDVYTHHQNPPQRPNLKSIKTITDVEKKEKEQFKVRFWLAVFCLCFSFIAILLIFIRGYGIGHGQGLDIFYSFVTLLTFLLFILLPIAGWVAVIFYKIYVRTKKVRFIVKQNDL